MVFGSPLGYLVYLAFVFLPGIGLGETLNIFAGRDTLTERLAVGFGLGLCADTLVMAIRTSGVQVLPSGLDAGSVDAVILVGAVLVLFPVVMRRRFSFLVKPKPVDSVVLITMAAFAVMLALYLQKYPIFPEYDSFDFTAHLGYVQGLISGQATSVPAGILYYGVHFQLASAYLLVGGNILEDINVTMAILVVFSASIFFLAALKLVSSTKVAMVAVLFYVFSGPIWFASVFNAGLYPNFFGVNIALLVIALTVDLQKDWSVKAWVALLITIPAMYFSHYHPPR